MDRRSMLRTSLIAAAQVPLWSAMGAAGASVAPTGKTIKSVELSRLQLTDIFTAIEQIPDSVLAQGDQAAYEWLKREIDPASLVIQVPQNALGEFKIEGTAPKGGTYQTQGALECGAAVGVALLSNAIPIAKLTKLKSFFQGVGGAATFARAFYNAFQRARSRGLRNRTAINAAINEAARAASPEIKDALLSFFSIGSVIAACS